MNQDNKENQDKPSLKDRLEESNKYWKQQKEQQCLHELCEDCHGSGIKPDGQACVHYLSCPCKKCTIIC